MIALKNAKHLKNLKADSEVKDWTPIPIFNSVPDNSDPGAPCHIYLTPLGIIFWRPRSSVIIPIAELKTLVKSIEPDFCSPPDAPKKEPSSSKN